ncbi:MAG: hypothetical protein IT513_01580 [Burkholderiales bacterium]|nr:hypothetical protein [Burkholderiales bacterium]
MLVGGQALAFWVAWFGVNVRDAPRAYISGDADFLGSREHVARFAAAIDGKAVYPDRRGMTALAGAVEKKSGTAGAGIDVLHRLVGLDAEGVQRRAVEVTHPVDATVRFRVMDPVDCLASRLENLRRLAAKRDAAGAWHARLAVAVCRAYVEELLRLGEQRKAIRVATALFRLAGTAAGLQAYAKHGVDVLEAVPIERFPGASFRREQARRSLTAIRRLRKEIS